MTTTHWTTAAAPPPVKSPLPPPPTPSHRCVPHPPTSLQQTATSEEVLLVPCRRAIKQALLSDGERAGMTLRPNSPRLPTILTSLPLSASPSVSFYSYRSTLSLFFTERKAETSSVCFPCSPGQVPVFKAQVLANRESSFRKTPSGLSGHRGGVGRWAGAVGRRTRLDFDVSLLWMLSPFKPVRRSVTCQSNSQQHIPLC